MSRRCCGAGAPGLPLICYLPPDHAGDHQGYLAAHDAVLFWPNEKKGQLVTAAPASSARDS